MTANDELRSVFGAGSLYDVLGVTNDATQDEIKKAYLNRCRELHPDKVIDPKEKEISTKKLHSMKKAYQTLCDRNLRKDYDESYSCMPKDQLESFLRCETIGILETREIGDYLCYDCRCSGQFKLSKHSVTPLVNDAPDIFIVECDSCSETIKITRAQ